MGLMCDITVEVLPAVKIQNDTCDLKTVLAGLMTLVTVTYLELWGNRVEEIGAFGTCQGHVE